MRFREGDIVKISKKCEYYGDHASNPADIKGTITLTRPDFFGRHVIKVTWDNFTDNYYDEKDLRLVRRE